MDGMKRSPGITFCAIFIFMIALYDLRSLADARWYWHLFQYLPPEQIPVRYAISLLGRILLIVAGIGIWQLRNWGRFLALGLCAANLVSLPWKHPAIAVANSLTYRPVPLLQELLQDPANQNIDFITPSVIILTVWSFIVFAGLCFFFTRKSVKKQFNSKISHQP